MNEYNHGLVFKWLKSENCSSKESKRLAKKTREAFNLTAREYRKMLSYGRRKTRILERLMSLNQWDKIDFSKIPSKAGLKYKKCFANKDIIKKQYENFAKDKNTKVNADVLNPVDIAHQIFCNHHPSETERLMWDKYWANLKDYYNGREENGIAIVDVSGSMSGIPMEAAVSMGAYIAERGRGPFQNHFITFSDRPELVEFNGTDLYDKFRRAQCANWSGSTNIEATFDLLLNTALKNHCTQEEIPQTLYIFSDMEFNACIACGANLTSRDWLSSYYNRNVMRDQGQIETLLEGIARKWAANGYEKFPRVIFWNLDARQNNIPALGGRFSYVSGFSMSMVEQILSGEDGYSLMMRTLNNERYSLIN